MVSRQDLQSANKILIKVGTSVLTKLDGTVALGRVGHLVEEICELLQEGKQIAFVSSGSTWVGRRKLKQQEELTRSLSNGNLTSLSCENPHNNVVENKRAFAACGQSGLMSLYDTLFTQKNVLCSQVLLTNHDLEIDSYRDNVKETIEHMMSLGIIPIINENDVVKFLHNSGNEQSTSPSSENLFTNNDALASILGSLLKVDLLVLLTDVDGLYEKPPGTEGPNKVIPTFIVNNNCQENVKFECGGGGIGQGTGGMTAKIEAAENAIKNGVKYVMISSGKIKSPITRVINGEEIGTLFVDKQETNGSSLPQLLQEEEESNTKMAQNAKLASLQLSLLSDKKRNEILQTIAKELLNRKEEIIRENEKDLQKAKEMNITGPLFNRLKLTSDKIDTLSKGISQISEMTEPTIGKVIRKTEISKSLHLEQITVPIGVLLIIFESRPDVLPQIAALSIKTGNGVLMKGGKEAIYSCRMLHKIIIDSIEKVIHTENIQKEENNQQSLISKAIGLVEARKDIDELLKMNEYIDLVIPRGGNTLVKYIQENTKIPVLGHADGICHIYIDKHADLEKAKMIVKDAKTDYPSACNSVETLLIDNEFKYCKELLEELTKNNEIKLFANTNTFEKLISMNISVVESNDTKLFTTEYGNTGLTVHFVEDLNESIGHINKYGSHHTDCIVSEDQQAIDLFLKSVDSACVFHNCSTRFADGFRFGLGAEVGISTGRIHARGPVGLEGLLTTKWILTSRDCDLVKEYSGQGCKNYLFEA
ncbi:hypothetical protein ABK040_005185 [Willaertia magna]